MPERILVVDDEPFILRSLSFVFRREGFEVFEARDGIEAMEQVRRIRPALVFLDLMMPRKDGYAVCREIKGDPDLAETFVIILTAKGQDSDRDRGLAAGADEYLTKPFSPSRIVQRAREILRGEGAGAPGTAG
jgi:DNA-binding response OmpR family regulator